MVNSTQYRKHAIKSNVPYMLALKRYWKPMLGTSLAWFWSVRRLKRFAKLTVLISVQL